MILRLGRLEVKIIWQKPKPLKHGTRSGYEKGCRCEQCVNIRRKYQKEYMAKKRKEGKWK